MTNRFRERAEEAARQTDQTMPITQGTDVADLLMRAVPADGDRREILDLIEKVGEATETNRRKTILLDGLCRNGNAIFSILEKVARWI